MTSRPERDPASFRDPSGHVYVFGDRVFRSITASAVREYSFVKETGLLRRLADEGKLVEWRETDMPATDLGEPSGIVVEHPRLDFVSYPYEWTFSLLRAAALLQLDIQLDALSCDVTMSDASAYNIQFDGACPIFIDLLSFRRYRPGEYWVGHRQFCQQFLNPLLLWAKCGVPYNGWYRGEMEGIDPEALAGLLPWSSKINPVVFAHVWLLSRLQRKARNWASSEIERLQRRELPKSRFRSMLLQLRDHIAGLTPPRSVSTTWENYEEYHSYGAEEIEAKKRFVAEFVGTAGPRVLWDIGCNTGRFAELALEAGAGRVIGFDMDHGALELAYHRAKERELRFLPLLSDAANPSPGQGWRHRERKSIAERAGADGVIALALVHHLAIGRNIPLPDLVDWLVGLAPVGVIEFVGKEDPMVQGMLRLRDDIFRDYTRETFEAALRSTATVVEIRQIGQKNRWLYRFQRKKN